MFFHVIYSSKACFPGSRCFLITLMVVIFLQKTLSITFYMLINLKIFQLIMKHSFFLFLCKFKSFREKQVSKFKLIFFFNLLIQTFFIYTSRLFREYWPYSSCKFCFSFFFPVMSIIPVNFIVKIISYVMVVFDSLV